MLTMPRGTHLSEVGTGIAPQLLRPSQYVLPPSRYHEQDSAQRAQVGQRVAADHDQSAR
ncbi:MAG TPA: hypothetical protein VE673_12205 [Pseudonocardiaceae bacterium]|nr:hypothetical protein [Pseudonocardiaceae bacterium]